MRVFLIINYCIQYHSEVVICTNMIIYMSVNINSLFVIICTCNFCSCNELLTLAFIMIFLFRWRVEWHTSWL